MRYDKIIGTGGIGTGMLFLSPVMETLGRSESRLVTLSPAKDYCKQHIVLHYAAVLSQGRVGIYPVGYVGKDANGEKLLLEMERVGMDTRAVGRSRQHATMISICLQYPDKEGCNFTAVNTAANEVTPAYVRDQAAAIGINSRTIVAALPEVSVESRLELLDMGRRNGAYCVLSIPAAEAEDFLAAKAWQNFDLLAVNEEEAAALCGTTGMPRRVFTALLTRLRQINPDLSLLMTAGKAGAFVAEGGKTVFVPPLPCSPLNTTGAGDACLGGILAGLALGLPLCKEETDARFGETPLASAVELGTICAGMAVECEDTIAWAVNRENIIIRIMENDWRMGQWLIS